MCVLRRPQHALHARLLQLGAEELCPRTLADDEHPLGVDGCLSAWIPSLERAVMRALGRPVEGGWIPHFSSLGSATALRIPPPYRRLPH